MTAKDLIPPIHRAGWPFIGLAALIALLFGSFGLAPFLVGLLPLAFALYFFRDPPRVTPTTPGLVVSPADGKVVSITELIPEEGLGLGDSRHVRISIFLNVFDVHVNRTPADGVVSYVRYRAGKFFNASFDKASSDNERNALAIKLTGDHPYDGKRIGVVQIAGLIARRIVNDAVMDQKMKAGQRFGIIRFGSRTDLYLPCEVAPLVCVGQRVIGGETVMANLRGEQKPRKGEVR